MHDQYKTKVQKLTEELKRLEKEEKNSLGLLRCREEELLARKDMLLWEKNNEKVQVGFFLNPCTRICSLYVMLYGIELCRFRLILFVDRYLHCKRSSTRKNAIFQSMLPRSCRSFRIVENWMRLVFVCLHSCRYCN